MPAPRRTGSAAQPAGTDQEEGYITLHRSPSEIESSYVTVRSTTSSQPTTFHSETEHSRNNMIRKPQNTSIDLGGSTLEPHPSDVDPYANPDHVLTNNNSLPTNDHQTKDCFLPTEAYFVGVDRDECYK